MRYLTREGFRSIWVNRLMSLASVAVLMACLLIVGCGTLVFVNINAVLDRIEDQNVIMVYVNDDATEYETTYLKVRLQDTPNVADVLFIPREEAFKQQLADLGDDAQLLDSLDSSILPNAYKVTIKDMAAFSETVETIRTYDSILQIRESSDIANKLTTIRTAVTYIGLGVVAMLFLVSIFIVANTVRITMFSRRLEISIMKAVGATNAFIRWPFMVEGVLLGIIAGVVSLFVVWGMYELAINSFVDILAIFGGEPVAFTDYALYMLGGFVAVGILTGTFGSAVSMGKYLKEQGCVVADE